jgi:hypothetical protein
MKIQLKNTTTNITEKFLPDISTYHLEENSINLNQDFKDDLYSISKNDTKHQRFRICSMSVSSIKKTISHFMSTSNRANNSIIQLNNMFYVESDKEKEKRVYNKVIYDRKRPISYFLSKENNFGIIKCENITTYFVDSFMFSQFTSPKNIEKDSQVNCMFLVKDKEKNLFILDQDSMAQLNYRAKKDLQRDRVSEFIHELNFIMNESKYLEILKKFKCSKINYSLICFFLLFVIISLFIVGLKYDFFLPEEIQIKWSYVYYVILLVCEFFLIYFFFKLILHTFFIIENIRLYEILKYHLDRFDFVEKFFTEWNMKYFIDEGIFLTAPATIDYLQFNFSPEQEIELEHHDID